ncbi:MAG: hypothetical protein JHC26_04860 [Thermofilum sp.]|jgi:type III secretory pathway component EscV|uniref:hypothetical protein n=1 Tax=Thermofilum sp. TaxID=1961369 RepID=UPI002590021F|nr:hypothetical protein [Thermofilum sp.]MCI4408399.1 hypothetical protein [Thermofilum sp.]
MSDQLLVKEQDIEIEFEEHTASNSQISTPSHNSPNKSELVKIYLLSMRLPSRYLVQKVQYSKDKELLQEVRMWEGESAKLAKKIETLRREVYMDITRIFCHVEEYGTWIAVSEQAKEEATKISQHVVEKLRALGFKDDILERYVVKAIPIYLEIDEARELLYYAIRKLSEDVDELKQKIAEAEKERNLPAMRRLEKEKSYREALLLSFKNYLSSLS